MSTQGGHRTYIMVTKKIENIGKILRIALVAIVFSWGMIGKPKCAYAGDGDPRWGLVYIAYSVAVLTGILYLATVAVKKVKEKHDYKVFQETQRKEDAKLAARFDAGIGTMRYPELVGIMGVPTEEKEQEQASEKIFRRTGVWRFSFDKEKGVLTKWSHDTQ
jgi:hypothetical protein